MQFQSIDEGAASPPLRADNILVEAGTNELEVMIFTLDGHPYALNVAKVREVMMAPPVRSVPEPPPSVEGVFLHRGCPVTLVRLRAYLGLRPYPAEALRDAAGTRVIIAEFNGRLTAFRVDGIEGIRRVTSDQVESLPRMEEFMSTSLVALVRMGDGVLPIVDVESIVYSLGGGREREEEQPAAPVAAAAPAEAAPIERADLHIVMAEDSSTIRSLVSTRLRTRGYKHVRMFEDGKAAWDWLSQVAEAGGGLRGQVDLVISDIEMPQMDGLRLCRLIRESEPLKGLPVVIFSSLVNRGNENKGAAVGATLQIGKPDVSILVNSVDEILGVKPAAPPAGGAKPPPGGPGVA